MKHFISVVLKMFGILIASGIFAVALMTAVYRLPVDKMAEHVAQSEEMLRLQDDEYLRETRGFHDNFDTGTNIIILHEVIFPNSLHPLQDALMNPTANYFCGDLEAWITCLISHAQNRIYEEEDVQYYSRYWHGYLVVLKPLFLLFSLKQIYVLNGILLLTLNIWILYLLYCRLRLYAVAYALFGLCMNPFYIVFSFQLSAVMYALTISMILLLHFYEPQKRSQTIVYFIFLADGMMVAFFDFLTYPLVAYAVLFLTYILLGDRKEYCYAMGEMLKTGSAFVFGYGGFWAVKWIAATLFTDENVVFDGIQNVLHRVGATGMDGDQLFLTEKATPMSSIISNWNAFLDWKTLGIVTLLLVFVLFCCVWKKRRPMIHKEILEISFTVAMLPFAWYAVVCNHCTLHPFLEWREFCILFFGVAIALLSLTVEKTHK